MCPEVEKAGERYQPLPGRVRALPARRAVSRDQTAAPTKRHSPAARPRVLRDKSRRRCWLELPFGSDCWSSAAGAKPAHEQAKGQHEAHTHSGPFSAYRLPYYGCQPPPYVLESGPAPPPTPSHEDGSDGGAFCHRSSRSRLRQARGGSFTLSSGFSCSSAGTGRGK